MYIIISIIVSTNDFIENAYRIPIIIAPNRADDNVEITFANIIA